MTYFGQAVCVSKLCKKSYNLVGKQMCEPAVTLTCFAGAPADRTRSPLRTSLRSLQAVRNSRSLDISDSDCQPADPVTHAPSGLDPSLLIQKKSLPTVPPIISREVSFLSKYCVMSLHSGTCFSILWYKSCEKYNSFHQVHLSSQKDHLSGLHHFLHQQKRVSRCIQEETSQLG